MMLLIVTALTAVATVSDDPTGPYIDCIKAEVDRLSNTNASHEAIADSAVLNCEEFVSASAQAFVDETPSELLAAYADAGVTLEMYRDRQEQIGRDAGRAMALDMLADRNAKDTVS
ncbi:hypothetical protein [Aurantiacibacter hainanensis]|uniref:hypothetical protein n=1 Tax=Aurantiacibacter hainanensis TaxID=3076114 RepID=UPI0030C67387